MADATTGGAAGGGGTPGFGKFVAGLVIGIVIGGFAGAVLLPIVMQPGGGQAAKGPRPAGATPSAHQAEEDAARKAAEAAAADAKKNPPPGQPPVPTPTTPPTPK